MSIRAAERRDVTQLAQMIAQLAAHHGDAATISEDALERDALGPAPWLIVLVAQAAHELVGYAAIGRRSQLQFGLRGAELHHLFVAPAFRGKGLGERLISASLETARDLGCRYMTVGTETANRPAQRFYRACGFDPLPAPGPRFRIVLEGRRNDALT
ncbi:MAG: GNAT family N-acetyltransferase [Paracoccaceae bacterium]